MNTFENLYSRCSIRNFNGENITNRELNEILKSAYSAPVGRGRYDSLKLTIITNKEILNEWEETMSKLTNNPGMHPFYGAPTVILVSSEIPSLQVSNVNYSNAAIIVQNMALAAVELGVGACHIWGAINALLANEKLLEKLNLSKNLTPCCAIALGHTDEKYSIREIPENRIQTEYIK